MIKLFGIFFLFASSMFADISKQKESNFEIINGKKVYHPFQLKVIKKTVIPKIKQPTISKPIYKAISVEYITSK